MCVSAVVSDGRTCIWGVLLHHVNIGIKMENQKYGYNEEKLIKKRLGFKI